MNKINFIIPACFFITIIACNPTQIQPQSEKTEKFKKKEVFPFPKIIDKLGEENLITINTNWIRERDHHPYFFGKLNDTILIERNLGLFPELYKLDTHFSKGKYDNYFLLPEEAKEFKIADSVHLLIKVDTAQVINDYGRRAFPVLIMNQYNDTVYIGYGDQIPIVAEAISKNGKWEPIEERYIYMCGTGLNSIILPPHEIVITSELVYSGNFKTKLRIKLGNNYSNEFYVNINESQFESEWDAYGERKTLP